MKRATIVGGGIAAVLVLLALAAVYWAGGPQADRAAPPEPANPRATGAGPEMGEMSEAPDREAAGAAQRTEGVPPGFLYGRVTTTGGATHEGRLRWGGDQEAFWSDYFNGFKDENPWAALVLPERLPVERRPIEIFGMVIAQRERPAELGRPFMARFGEIARIEAVGGDVRVTLKSGTVFALDRFEASDFDDGVRVWDAQGGVVDLDSLEVRTIELLPGTGVSGVPSVSGVAVVSRRLHGTVRTQQGEFTGFLQWDRREGVGSDELDGRAAEGEKSLRFDSLRAIARRSPDSSLVTLLDGREIVLSGSSEVGEGNLGVYVDDRRYGRVLVSWEAFERVDFSPHAALGTGPGYDDFPPGRPLTGGVTTRDGRRLSGRLVFDLDESETTETLDAPSQGVDYTLPFELVASISGLSGILPVALTTPAGSAERSAPSARVTLQSGETLELERRGDLGAGNAGMLIFIDGGERPEYVPWSEVERLDFDRTPRVEPASGGL